VNKGKSIALVIGIVVGWQLIILALTIAGIFGAIFQFLGVPWNSTGPASVAATIVGVALLEAPLLYFWVMSFCDEAQRSDSRGQPLPPLPVHPFIPAGVNVHDGHLSLRCHWLKSGDAWCLRPDDAEEDGAVRGLVEELIKVGEGALGYSAPGAGDTQAALEAVSAAGLAIEGDGALAGG